MFCTHCGSQMDARARFCSACGARREDVASVPVQGVFTRSAQLVRPRAGRMIAGVCAGFAEHYGWDLSLVRVVAVLVTLLTTGAALLAYIAAWILIPDGQYALTSSTPPPPPAAPFESQTT